MDHSFPNTLEDVKWFRHGKPIQAICAYLPVVRSDKDRTVDAINRRMLIAREALTDLDASKYARKAGINPKTYLNFENYSRPGLDEATKLCITYHLSLDWIYFGDEHTLPGGVLDKIRAWKPRPDHDAKKPRRRFPLNAAE